MHVRIRTLDDGARRLGHLRESFHTASGEEKGLPHAGLRALAAVLAPAGRRACLFSPVVNELACIAV